MNNAIQQLRRALACAGCAIIVAACGGGGGGSGGGGGGLASGLGSSAPGNDDAAIAQKEKENEKAAAVREASPNPSSPGLPLGNGSEGSGTDSLVDASGQYINFNLFSAGEDAELDRIRAWVKGRAEGGGIAYRAAIYADTGTGPQLLSSAAQKRASASGWLELPLAARVSVRRNAAYWLAIWSDDAASGIGAEGGGTAGGLRWMKLGFANDWPAQPTRVDGEGGLRYAIHALKPGTTTPPEEPPTSNPARGWNVTASNVGLAGVGLSCDQLPVYTGSLKPASGTVLSGWRITGPLDLSNGNILVEKSCIRPDRVGEHHAYLVTTTTCRDGICTATQAGNVVIRDSEIDAEHLDAETISGSCAFLGVGTLERNYMHGMGSGICFFETGAVHSARAERNYVRGLRAWGNPETDGSHNEAATVRDFRDAPGRTLVFLNNRLECATANDTGALFIQPTWLPIHNVRVEGNYLEGGGYNLYLERTGNASYGNLQAVDNRFRPTGWNPVAVVSGPGFVQWSDNHRYDAARPDGKGDAVTP